MKAKKTTAFNDFMKINITKLKAENPNIKHTEAFGKAAALWVTAKENPKNQ